MEEVLPVSTDGVEAVSEMECGVCGNKEFRTKTLIIDERTGERPTGAAPLVGGILVTLFGLVCLVAGIALAVDPLPSNVDTMNPIYFIVMGLVVLGSGVQLLLKSLRRKKVEVVRPECTVCWARWKQTKLFHQHRRGLVGSNMCFVAAGLWLWVVVSAFVSAATGGSLVDAGQAIVILLILMAIGGLLIYGGIVLRRRARGGLAELQATVETDGEYYHCACGRPKYPYYWAHIALCFTVYGLIALFFPSKRCPKCRTPFVKVAVIE